LLRLLIAVSALFASDKPCDKYLSAKVQPKDGNVTACIVSSVLVPDRQVVVAVFDYDDTDRHGGSVSILDLRDLDAGRRRPLYEDSSSEGMTPFLFEGRKTMAAIADFDHSGRMGFALLYLGDTDNALKIRVWNSTLKAFQPIPFWVKNEYDSLDIRGDPGTIEIRDVLILVRSCRAGWRGKDGVFPIVETFKLKGRRYEFDHDELDPKGKPSTQETGCSNAEDARMK
jgi:hypothetical protein